MSDHILCPAGEIVVVTSGEATDYDISVPDGIQLRWQRKDRIIRLRWLRGVRPGGTGDRDINHIEVDTRVRRLQGVDCLHRGRLTRDMLRIDHRLLDLITKLIISYLRRTLLIRRPAGTLAAGV